MLRQCCWPQGQSDFVSFKTAEVSEITQAKCRPCQALLHEALKDLQPNPSDLLRVELGEGGPESIKVTIEPNGPWSLAMLERLELSCAHVKDVWDYIILTS